MPKDEPDIDKQLWICELEGNGYYNSDALEYHLRKEHTKTDFIAYLKTKGHQY